MTLKPRKKPRQERSKFTVDMILEASVHVFEQRGYHKATTKHIAEHAGVSVGTLYQYFPNKESILCSLMEHHIQKTYALITDVFEKIVKSNKIDSSSVEYFVKSFLKFHQKETSYHRIVLKEVQNAGQLLNEWIENAEKGIMQFLEDLFAKSEFIHVKYPKMAARLCSQMVNALVHKHILSETDENPDREFIHELTEILSCYLF